MILLFLALILFLGPPWDFLSQFSKMERFQKVNIEK